MHLLAALSVLWQDYAIKEVRTAVVVNLHTIDGVWSKPLYVMVGILRTKLGHVPCIFVIKFSNQIMTRGFYFPTLYVLEGKGREGKVFILNKYSLI